MDKNGGRSALNEGKVGDEMRRGPWTEQEDLQLVWFVRLFGERRWDFLAKVSGLNRSGKSCRLRWVNYLHPGLKRGRMTLEEEQLVLELHAKWGNRWSRIARKLPGRTDNEIKNYWRTHMRKKAQERCDPNLSGSPSASSWSDDHSSVNDNSAEISTNERDCGSTNLAAGIQLNEENCKGYTLMDQIWNEIAACEPEVSELSFQDYNTNRACPPSPMWEDCAGSLGKMDEDEFKTHDLIPSSYQHSKAINFQ